MKLTGASFVAVLLNCYTVDCLDRGGVFSCVAEGCLFGTFCFAWRSLFVRGFDSDAND